MTQIQEIENLSQLELVKLVHTERQQHADDMDMLSKELASRAFMVPKGWKLVPLEPTEAMYDAWLEGKDNTRNYWNDVYTNMLAAAPTAPVDPYRVLMADQAELINIERLQHWLTKYGISSPESMEELGAERGHYVNALTREEPFAPAAPAALRYAAKVIELYDDATMRADYMLSSTDCAEILEALAEYFTVHPRVSRPQLVQVYKINDISGSVDSDLAQPCTCPSGDGSLRWPCPVHPPESEQKVQQ